MTACRIRSASLKPKATTNEWVQMSKKPELRLRFFMLPPGWADFFVARKPCRVCGSGFLFSLFIPPFSRFSALLLCFFRFPFFFRPSTFPLSLFLFPFFRFFSLLSFRFSFLSLLFPSPFFFRPSTFPLMNRQPFGKRRKPFLKLQADFVR